MRAQLLIGLGVILSSGACTKGSANSADPDPTSMTSAGNGGSSGTPAGGGGAPANSGSGAAGVAGSTPADGGSMTDGITDDGATPAAEPVPLPADSRELDDVVNLVSEEAAAELDAYLSDSSGPMHAVLRLELPTAINLFLRHYEEVHDFLFVFTDHPVTGATTVGRFASIHHRAEPGGANEIEIALAGYHTTGRLRAAIAVQWRTPIGPPLSHEIMHEWAAHLDQRFGFGLGNGNVGYGPHWGFVDFYGQLGGFDGTTLRCETPTDALPPGCTPLGSGRTRYVVSQFFPNSNPPAQYAPLELYLMGVLPASDVPETFRVLEGAEQVPDSFDPDTDTLIVEADAIREVAFADIVARHGTTALLPEDERHWSAAFVVVSATPASDEVMADVAEWAAAFGDRGTSGVVDSFASLTGDRATLDTRLGPRRSTDSPLPELSERFECDVLAQDCPRPELACYGFTPNVCALSQAVAEGTACDSVFACAAGLDCFSGPSDPDAFACTPYCDPDDDASPQACATLCPGMEQRFIDENDATVGAVCLN